MAVNFSIGIKDIDPKPNNIAGRFKDDLINKVRSYNKFLNPETLNKAYDFALKAHKTQKRDAGEPYIIHPVAVADILTELKLDSATITTGLLHDTIEDTNMTISDITDIFGDQISELVQGLTKISKFSLKINKQKLGENYRKLLLATTKDLRIILIKLADRLHNMKTLDFLKDHHKINYVL